MEERRVLVDRQVPTSRKVPENRPDMVVRLNAIFEVACAWEPPRDGKEDKIPADLAKVWKGHK